MGLFGKPAAGVDKFAGGIPPVEGGPGPLNQPTEPPTGMNMASGIPGMPGATIPVAAPVATAELSPFGEMGSVQVEGAVQTEPSPFSGTEVQAEIPSVPSPAVTEEPAPSAPAPTGLTFGDATGFGKEPVPSPYEFTRDPLAGVAQEADPPNGQFETQPLGPYQEGVPVPQVPEPTEHIDTQEFHIGNGPCFTKVQPDDENYAGKFSLDMPHVDYVGSTEILLKTLRDLEQHYKISMPIRSCGLDPVVFENAAKGDEENAPENQFIIMDGETPVKYELVTVDGAMYASCMSAPLDTEYLHSVIREATMSITEQGYYIFHMVGLCVLATEGSGSDSLMRTLRLNSYELSVLCEYMESFGTDVEYGTYGGRQCIYFKAKS